MGFGAIVGNRSYSNDSSLRPPLVHVGVVGIDASKDDNLRLSVRAESITQHGFTLSVETWLNTKIWTVEVSWLAIGSCSSAQRFFSESSAPGRTVGASESDLAKR